MTDEPRPVVSLAFSFSDGSHNPLSIFMDIRVICRLLRENEFGGLGVNVAARSTIHEVDIDTLLAIVLKDVDPSQGCWQSPNCYNLLLWVTYVCSALDALHEIASTFELTSNQLNLVLNKVELILQGAVVHSSLHTNDVNAVITRTFETVRKLSFQCDLPEQLRIARIVSENRNPKVAEVLRSDPRWGEMKDRLLAQKILTRPMRPTPTRERQLIRPG